MKRLFQFLITLQLLLLNTFSFGLSPEAKISLVTVAPGEELYSSFGHSALWVYDPVNGIDNVYNYGTFEFNDDFYGKFIRGKLDYMLSVASIDYLMAGAYEERRSVTEQILNLSPSQEEKLYQLLENNALPENKYYRYDFFFDNCSSRLRDMVVKTLGDNLKFDLSKDKRMSFRDLIDDYLTDKEIQDLGMDIGLGQPADKLAKPYEYMFLPDYLESAFSKAEIIKDSQTIPLVAETKVLYKAPQMKEQDFSVFKPVYALWILFMVVAFISYKNLNKPQKKFPLDSFMYGFIGLLGFLLVFLWFFTDHTVTKNNWDLVWAWPIHFFFAFVLNSKNYRNFKSKYLIIYALIVLGLLVILPIIPQKFNNAEIPLLLILALRSLYIYKKLKDVAL